jgi:hypothetical protein
MNAVLPSPPDDHARRIVDTVNRFGGTLHAARCMAQICIQNAASPAFSIAAKYGLQMTFGTSILTLRKFQDNASRFCCDSSGVFECRIFPELPRHWLENDRFGQRIARLAPGQRRRSY